MVPGFNTDFKYRGETYHVQTEDNGVANPVVVSLLYHKGAILASRRTPYTDLVDKPGFQQELAALMKNQHKDLMRSLLAGAFDKDGGAPMIAGGSGSDPAAAAAAVAAREAEAPKSAPQPAPPAAATQPAAAAAPAPFASRRAPAAPRVAAPVQAASAPPVQAPAPTPATARPAVQAQPAAPRTAPTPASSVAALTLDEAIWDYLKHYAATASVAAH